MKTPLLRTLREQYWLRAGVAVTGALLDATGSWSYALFAPSVFLFVTGIAVFAAFGSANLQDFDADNEPFWCARLAKCSLMMALVCCF